MFIRLTACLVLVLVASLPALGQQAEGESGPDYSHPNPWQLTGSIGVVVVNERGLRQDHAIKIYNEDRSLWYQYSFYKDDAVNTTRADFRPLSFFPEYTLLVLKCVGRTGDSYEVVVNEETSTTRLVRINSKNLKFQSWPQHLLDSYAVEFDQSSNPLLTSPSGRKTSFRPTDEHSCRAKVIQGNWLKVSCAVDDPTVKSRAHVGWVKWRDSQKLLVQVFYLP